MIQLYLLNDKLSNINWNFRTMHKNARGEIVHVWSDDLGDLIDRINHNRNMSTISTFPTSQYNLIEEFESFDKLIQFIHDNYPEECI